MYETPKIVDYGSIHQLTEGRRGSASPDGARGGFIGTFPGQSMRPFTPPVMQFPFMQR